MKLSALTISAAVLAVACGGSALAQATAPVTMQPVPNPPEKAAAAGKHHSKHHATHAKAETKSDAPADTAAPPAK